MRFDGLGTLDSLSEGVLNVVGPLVDRISSVDIKSVVPLRILPVSFRTSKSKETNVQGDPNLSGSDPWW